jgi:sterol desaturase/sphingolipid hydroxylase (fatty acid hydroxylase superfamily)
MLNLTTLLNFNFVWPSIPLGEKLALALLMFFTLISTLEFHAPCKELPIKHLRQSYKTNISLFFINSIAMSLVSISSLLIIANRYSDKGLLKIIPNQGLKFFLSFIALDLLMYFWHRASHRLDFIWMFHKVHHNDPYLNISTAFRIHFIELFITNTLKAALVVVLGIEQAIVLANEALLTAFIMFHHANITFKAEQLLSYIFIVPSLHRTHHSTQRCEHDSNFGAVFSFWDRLFGTMTTREPAEIGINGSSPLDLINLIKFGVTRNTAATTLIPIDLDAMIAEAAYYKAEKRGFYPGNELRDWLEAKTDIITLVYEKKTVKNHPPGQRNIDYFKQMKLTIIQDF